MRWKLLVVAALVASTTTVMTSFALAGGESSVAAVRAATAKYHQLAVAQADNYGLFTDAAGIACIANPPDGTMGVHYVNLGLVLDGGIDAATPEALVYEPEKNGNLRLVAVEYVVFQSAWDASHASPPSLFGQEFGLVPAGNRYGLPPFYELHAWIWKHNPSGMFYEWNPTVTCG
jgi:hypothetical protein